MKIAIILGSVRPQRMSSRVGKMVATELDLRKHTVTMFDPADVELSLLERPLHWYGPSEEKPKKLVDLYMSLKDQDAFIIITPEYNLS